MIEPLPGREHQVVRKESESPTVDIACNRPSIAGSVSQRACVFCGSRVVLYPIADVIHLVHGPIGCAAYTWDIRGALSSGPQLHRNSFSTDLQELDVIYGGEKKLEAALLELIALHHPNAAFVYSTCIVGLIGDDVGAVCRRVSEKTGIPVLPVHSEGFKGTKRDGYRAAPSRGGGDDRWLDLGKILSDCCALLVVSAGPKPKKMLSANGLRIIEMEGLIEEGLAAAYSNGQVPAVLQRRFMGCSKGASCRGSGMGCN